MRKTNIYIILFLGQLSNIPSKTIPMDFPKQTRNLTPIISSFRMLIIFYIVSDLFRNNILNLACGIIKGISYYFFINILFNSKDD
jgi:hypothetical protein